jgi:hypothetical protein
LTALLPLYRSISVATVGDGRRTSFWLDNWTGGGAIGVRWPVLLSHALDAGASVHGVLTAGVRHALVPRLTTAGARLLPELLALVSATRFSEEVDVHHLVRCRKRTGALDTGAFYRLRTFGGVNAPYHSFVWQNRAPSRVKFFAWLLSRCRVQSRAALLRKGILSAPEAICPVCLAPLETADHIFLLCPFARRFWDKVGVLLPPEPDVRRLCELSAPAAVPSDNAVTFMLLCLWNVWKHRNAVVFREQQPSLPLLLQWCREDARFWCARLPGDQAAAMAAWLHCLRAGAR